MSLQAVLSDHDPDGHCLEFDSPRQQYYGGSERPGEDEG